MYSCLQLVLQLCDSNALLDTIIISLFLLSNAYRRLFIAGLHQSGAWRLKKCYRERFQQSHLKVLYLFTKKFHILILIRWKVRSLQIRICCLIVDSLIVLFQICNSDLCQNLFPFSYPNYHMHQPWKIL